MSSVRIALQPPPNVDFVVGYPGIPPGARDRPQASVKGAVEVRVGPAGARAKWVRIELKKIETLPGGGQANSYVDHVGPSAIPLWQSSEDYSLLHSQDFPFLIRIPESIPPSIALEKGAGIRYELVATVCTLGKMGFFRRRKTTVISQATTIIIDKHELHSTWPVYSQPESRSTYQDNIHLAVERSRTCYGPGDRVSIMAIVKSESVRNITLRGFEFTLKETTVFRAGPHPSSKRSGPQTKLANIGEQKVPMNLTLYNGMQHKAELGCLIPNTHTTTTLNAARHIDITYVIIVKAWIESMQAIMLELPVIVSNWPRNVSEEAIRRIGPAPSLCVTSPSSPAATVPITTSITRSPTSNSYQDLHNRTSSADEFGVGSRSPPVPAKRYPYSTGPKGHNGSANAGLETDELGALGGGSGARVAGTVNHPGYGPSSRPTSRGRGGVHDDYVRGGTSSEGHAIADPRVPGVGRRRGSTNPQHPHRLTITNYSEKDVEDGIAPRASVRETRPATSPGRNAQRGWLSAEDEKKLLYENAVERVKVVQGAAALANATAGNDIPSAATPSATTTSKPSQSSPWPTAELEKVRLYEHAQATAKRVQANGVSSPSLHSRSSSDANSHLSREKSSSPGVRSGYAISAGEALYSQAVSSISHNGPSSPQSIPQSISRVPHYLSAEEEKAALKRYHEAKLAVDRNQNTQFASRDGIGAGSSGGSGAPVSYDTLYPEPDGQGRSDMPPPFDASGSSGQPRYLSEKERLRRQYEAQDAAALAAQGQVQAPTLAPAPEPERLSPGTPLRADRPPEEPRLSEKEILRRRLEEQDRVALALQQQQQQQRQQEQDQPSPPLVPPRVNGIRAPPVPPSRNGFKPLTAAEEKAQLRAKYEAEQQAAANGDAGDAPAPSPTPVLRHPYATATLMSESAPPPLMPRPPAEYIQETQEADLRGRYYDSLGLGLAQALDHSVAQGPPQVASPTSSHPHLDVRPFSPFDVSLGYDVRSAVSSPAPLHGHGHVQIRPPPPPPAAQY